MLFRPSEQPSSDGPTFPGVKNLSFGTLVTPSLVGLEFSGGCCEDCAINLLVIMHAVNLLRDKEANVKLSSVLGMSAQK